MGFTRESNRVAVAIGDVHIHLYDYAVGSGETDGAAYEVEIIYDDGSHQRKTGNLGAELSAAHQTQVQNLLAAVRAKSCAEDIAVGKANAAG